MSIGNWIERWKTLIYAFTRPSSVTPSDHLDKKVDLIIELSRWWPTEDDLGSTGAAALLELRPLSVRWSQPGHSSKSGGICWKLRDVTEICSVNAPGCFITSDAIFWTTAVAEFLCERKKHVPIYIVSLFCIWPFKVMLLYYFNKICC